MCAAHNSRSKRNRASRWNQRNERGSCDRKRRPHTDRAAYARPWKALGRASLQNHRRAKRGDLRKRMHHDSAQYAHYLQLRTLVARDRMASWFDAKASDVPLALRDEALRYVDDMYALRMIESGNLPIYLIVRASGWRNGAFSEGGFLYKDIDLRTSEPRRVGDNLTLRFWVQMRDNTPIRVAFDDVMGHEGCEADERAEGAIADLFARITISLGRLIPRNANLYTLTDTRVLFR